jgi:peptidoglycan/xylan/chitin deacetylase (PgdA/CDA1 family)
MWLADGWGLRLRGVPVLIYHGVAGATEAHRVPPDDKYWILEDTFRDHLALVRRAGYSAALLGDVWRHHRPPASPSVVLSVDDGRACDYATTYPRLLDAGVRAEFFVNTASIGTPGFLEWSHVAEMHRTGMSFQSHGHDHVSMIGLSPAALRRQLADSKRILEGRLGSPVDFLAVPYGLLSRRVVGAAEEAGYLGICTSRAWPASPGARIVNRVVVHRHTTLDDLGRLLRRHPAPYLRAAARGALVYAPTRLLLRTGLRTLEAPA